MQLDTTLRALVAGATLLAASAATAAQDTVETAKPAGNFNTLVMAIEAAGLTDTLQGAGPFTISAPTDEAFPKLPADTVDALLKDKAKLTKILTYHVVAGHVIAKAVKPGTVTTVEGSKLSVTNGNYGVKVDSARVVATGVAAGNGVLRVIDTVVIPS